MKKQLSLDYILMQMLYYFLLGILTSYGSYALIQIGYNNATIGIIMSLGSLFSALIQPLAANISDNSKRFSLFNVCIFISIISVIMSALSLIKINATFLMFIIYVGLFGIYTVLEPLINAVPAILRNNGIEIKYGVGRAIGSIGYASASALLGILTVRYPYQVVFVSAGITAIILLLVNIKANRDFLTIPNKINKKENEETISYSNFLKRHKSFIALMICTACIYFAYTMFDNTMYLVVENVGGDSKDLGLILAFKACLEVPVIFFYDKLEKLATPKNLLKISVISFAAKAGIQYLAKSIFMLYVDQLIQLSAFSLMVPATVSYINKIMDKSEVARGHALYITSVSIAQVLSSPISGFIVDKYSVSTMLLVSFVIMSLSALAYIIAINKAK